MEKKILIAEDDDVIRKVCERMAIKFGFSTQNICTVDSAEDALEQLKHRQFDILLTDNDMGAMTGLELIAQCKKSFPNTVPILMSGRIKELVSSGKIPNGLYTLAKPFEIEKMEEVIKKALI